MKLNWIGRRFAMLTIIEATANPDKFLCLCDCGNKAEVFRSNLYSRNTKSCGCLFLKFTKAPRKYNDIDRLTYGTWQSIVNRCNTKGNKTYEYYGGRGIGICDRWLDYTNFVEDMGKRPSKDFTIDRIDYNGNYEISNCRWATKKEQANNRRKRVDAVKEKACLVCGCCFFPKKKHNKFCSIKCNAQSQTKGWINHGDETS